MRAPPLRSPHGSAKYNLDEDHLLRTELEQHIRNRNYAAALPLSSRLYDAQHPVGEIAAMHGHVLQQLERHDEARPVLEQAGKLLPAMPSVWIDLAHACIAARDWRAAADAVARFRRLAPTSGAGYFAEAEVLLAGGQRDRAETLFRQAMAQHAGFVARRLRLAGQAADAGDAGLADWHYRATVEAHPEVAQAHSDYLAFLFQQGHYAEAAGRARAALKHRPDDTRLLQRLSILLDLTDCDAQERIDVRGRWVRLAPDSIDARVALGNAYASAHDFAQAQVEWRRAVEMDPAQPMARWNALHFPDTTLPGADADLHAFRQRWDNELRQLLAQPLPDDDVCLRMIQSCASHYLIYAAEDVLSSQRLRGEVLSRLCDRVLPVDAAPARRPIERARRRVGVVSSNFGWHSVTRVWRELMLGVDRSQIELICFDIGSHEDPSVEEWRRRSDAFVEWQGGLPGCHKALMAADLDIAIFLDLGPHAGTQALATRRYAPVQCTTWAYPLTSGLATIDYFLSSDRMEPEQSLAQSHYSETLVRLHGMACAYQPQVKPASDAPAEPVVDAAAPVRFLCAQTHYKLFPAHDALFARILEGAPSSRLTLSHGADAIVSTALRSRLLPPLADRGITADRLQIHERVAFLKYLGILADTDVVLDSLRFSGCLTSLDALSMDLPIVTLPGRTMRGRQTAAMLELLEIPELIARDEDDYVRIALALANEPAWRLAIRKRIRERKQRLFEFDDSVRALTRFLVEVQPPDR
jgi:protein O-GlcNAc transferase